MGGKSFGENYDADYFREKNSLLCMYCCGNDGEYVQFTVCD